MHASPAALVAQPAAPRRPIAHLTRILPQRTALAARAGAAAEVPPAPAAAKARAQSPLRVPLPLPRRPPQQHKEDTWSLEDVSMQGWERDEAREAGRRWVLVQAGRQLGWQAAAFRSWRGRPCIHCCCRPEGHASSGPANPVSVSTAVRPAVCL